LLNWTPQTALSSELAQVIQQTLPKIVKIYGAGGIRRLEAYQSGFLISSDGHVLTAWSYVLDADPILAVLDDGRRFPAELLGADPSTELAVLKIDAAQLPHFHLDQAAQVRTGDRILAFSNLYGIATGDEPASILHGYVSAVTPLSARRGVYPTTYEGTVYVLDAMTNNAGAAGGALTSDQGHLVGILGKELRNAQNNTWLNYAVPIHEIRPIIDDLLQGKVRRRDTSDLRRPLQPMTLPELGLVLIPDVLPKTPPFIERVQLGSPAATAGLQADDLIVFVQSTMVSSCQEVLEEISFVDRLQPVRITVLRDQELIEVDLSVER
jgi:serine protease Do